MTLGTVRYLGEPEFEHDRAGRVGVLLANLGTPDAPTPRAVRRYLSEFLWDPRVIETPRWLWWLVLHGVILRVRPSRSAAAYRLVWTAQGSPLLVFGERQARALAERLHERWAGRVTVALGMRYGRPSIAAALETLRAAGARRLLVLPLYPQYSGATTASTFDALAATFSGWRWLPELRFVTSYHDHPGYLDALAQSVREQWSREGQAERLLFSFHGLPRRYLLAGDPYHCQCHKTARLVAERLALPAERWAVAFQSRVGREEWLRPYTDELLAEWARSGVGAVQVICPGFAADCLETLEEIALRNRDDFLAAGGRSLSYVPALNDRPGHIDALADLVEEATRDWRLRPSDDPGLASDLAARRERAVALGASR